jgi:pimeloyl-ACP methyl ester carboxylesterase
MASLIPGARFEWIDKCGHLLTWERPRRLNDLLVDWLANL